MFPLPNNWDFWSLVTINSIRTACQIHCMLDNTEYLGYSTFITLNLPLLWVCPMDIIYE